MLERFDDEARRALAQAEREARALKHGYVGTEHLLLALLHDEGAIAARALRLLGVNRRKARARILKLVDVGAKRVEGPIAFTPRVKEIIEDAFLGAVPAMRGAPAKERPVLVGPAVVPPPRMIQRGLAPFAGARRLARLAALQKGYKVGSSDLLLALVAHEEGVGSHVLRELGVDLERAFAAATRVRYPQSQSGLGERGT